MSVSTTRELPGFRFFRHDRANLRKTSGWASFNPAVSGVSRNSRDNRYDPCQLPIPRRTEVQLGVKRACVHFNKARCDAWSSGV